MTPSDLQLLLRAHPALAGLPAELLGRLASLAEPAAAGEGQELFGEGSPATHCPLVVEGRVRVSRVGVGGEEVLLYRLAPGELCAVSALALLGGTAHAATGIAEAGVRLVRVPRAIFTELLLASPRFRAYVFEGLAGRLAQLAGLVHDLVFRRVDERLASQLLTHPRPIVATHQMLACEVGSSREVVSRILEGFQATGLIRLGRRRIEILDPAALEQLTGLGLR